MSRRESLSKEKTWNRPDAIADMHGLKIDPDLHKARVPLAVAQPSTPQSQPPSLRFVE